MILNEDDMATAAMMHIIMLPSALKMPKCHVDHFKRCKTKSEKKPQKYHLLSWWLLSGNRSKK